MLSPASKDKSNSICTSTEDKDAVIANLKADLFNVQSQLKDQIQKNDLICLALGRESMEKERYKRLSEVFLREIDRLEAEAKHKEYYCNDGSNIEGLVGYVVKRRIDGATTEELIDELKSGKPFKLSQPMIYALVSNNEYLEKERRAPLSRNTRIEALKVLAKSNKNI